MTQLRRRWAWPLSLVALTLWLATAHAQAPDDTPDERVLGAWTLASSEAEARRLVNAAVNETANAMDFFVRGFARSRLRQGTPVRERIEIRRPDGERVTVRFDRETYTTTLGRAEVRRNPAGEPVQVTARFGRDGELVQVFETAQGTRTYVYRPTDEGLRVTTRTESPRLPRPMVFTLEYRRVD